MRCHAPWVIALVLLPAAPAPLAAQVVHGTVVDAATAAPVVGAVVSLLPAAGDSAVATALTSSEGRFLVRAPRPGGYRLRVEHIAYGPLTTEPRYVPQDGVVTVRVEVTSAPVALAPLQVEQERLEPPFMREFRQRMALDWGEFVTREEMERMGNVRLATVLGTVPGVWLREYRRNPNDPLTLAVELNRAQTAAGPCETSVYLNGLRISGSGSIDNDYGQTLRTLTSEEIEAIEVYRGVAELPDVYSGSGSNCGVVAIWLRRGGEIVAEESLEGIEPVFETAVAVGGGAALASGDDVSAAGLGWDAQFRLHLRPQLWLGLAVGRTHHRWADDVDAVHTLHILAEPRWHPGTGTSAPFVGGRLGYARRGQQTTGNSFASHGVLAGALAGVAFPVGRALALEVGLTADWNVWGTLEHQGFQREDSATSWGTLGLRVLLVRGL